MATSSSTRRLSPLLALGLLSCLPARIGSHAEHGLRVVDDRCVKDTDCVLADIDADDCDDDCALRAVNRETAGRLEELRSRGRCAGGAPTACAPIPARAACVQRICSLVRDGAPTAAAPACRADAALPASVQTAEAAKRAALDAAEEARVRAELAGAARDAAAGERDAARARADELGKKTKALERRTAELEASLAAAYAARCRGRARPADAGSLPKTAVLAPGTWAPAKDALLPAGVTVQARASFPCDRATCEVVAFGGRELQVAILKPTDGGVCVTESWAVVHTGHEDRVESLVVRPEPRGVGLLVLLRARGSDEALPPPPADEPGFAALPPEESETWFAAWHAADGLQLHPWPAAWPVARELRGSWRKAVPVIEIPAPRKGMPREWKPWAAGKRKR